LFSKDDDYDDWIKCGAIEEDARMQQRLGKNIEPNVHLYLVQIFDDLIEGGRLEENCVFSISLCD
jgi:hypothetical protein